jgi:hypothetical protein
MSRLELEHLRAALAKIEADRRNPWYTRADASDALRYKTPSPPPPPLPRVSLPPGTEMRGV